MTGYIFDIKKFAIHDGPGIRTTVFLKGCPLKCWWCHNPESIKQINDCGDSASELTKRYSVPELLNIIQKDQIFYDESGGGVTFSGGEPLVQSDFLVKILKECKKKFITTTVDTCGYVPTESVKRIYTYTDLFLYDLKLFDDELHKKYIGVSNELIKNNLEFLYSVNSNVRIRVPLIPNITDTEDNLSAVSNYLLKFNGKFSLDLLPYNKLSEDKYRRLNQNAKLGSLETQTSEKLIEIKNFVKSFGLNAELNG